MRKIINKNSSISIIKSISKLQGVLVKSGKKNRSEKWVRYLLRNLRKYSGAAGGNILYSYLENIRPVALVRRVKAKRFRRQGFSYPIYISDSHSFFKIIKWWCSFCFFSKKGVKKQKVDTRLLIELVNSSNFDSKLSLKLSEINKDILANRAFLRAPKKTKYFFKK